MAQVAYDSFVNRSICMSPFEVVHGYKPRKPLDLLLMSLYARISKLAESFTHKIQDLHVKMTKQIQASNA
jgi:hypothetical protein